MKSRIPVRRSGFSLMEVLVSLLILLIGVTSVIALFPVAVARIRQAVLDTRCTFVGRSMWDIVELKEMTNDPLHLDPSPPTNPTAPADYTLFLQSPFYRGVDGSGRQMTDPITEQLDSYYFNIVDGTAPTAAPDTTTPPVASATRLQSDCDSGIPLLIDPAWVESDIGAVAINGDGWVTDRQTAAVIPTGTPFDQLFDDAGNNYTPASLRVVTTWEVASIADSAVRRSFVRRWFTSPEDVQYREDVAGIPVAPSNVNVSNDPGSAFPLADSAISAQREYPYSWALMLQRDVDPDSSAPNINHPPLLSSEYDARILVFYRRNLQNPFTAASACFVDGDNRVTVRYDPSEKPHLRRGMWFAEVTIEGNTMGDRRTFQFHRIADYEDAIVAGEPVIAVTLETEPTGYNATARAAGDFPDAAPSATLRYFPIILFDGLQEVYGLPTF